MQTWWLLLLLLLLFCMARVPHVCSSAVVVVLRER
jgi:hypothetical protein